MPSFRPLTREDHLIGYRRHSKKCEEKWADNHPGEGRKKPTPDPRYHPEVVDDCLCSIVVKGTLRDEPEPIRHVALGADTWIEAREKIRQLERDGRLELPKPPEQPSQEPKVITVFFAAETFLLSKGPHSTKPIACLNKYETHLGAKLDKTGKKAEFSTGRLLPWCKLKGITNIKSLDSKVVAETFVRSWYCLDDEDEPLANSTKTIELTYFRAFMEYCLDAGWMTKNWAKKIPTPPPPTEAELVQLNHGLELDEFDNALHAILYHCPKRKWAGKNDLTPERVQAAMELMFWCGPRAIDVTKFNSSEIIPSVENGGACIYYEQRKTRKMIGEPVPLPEKLMHA